MGLGFSYRVLWARRRAPSRRLKPGTATAPCRKGRPLYPAARPGPFRGSRPTLTFFGAYARGHDQGLGVVLFAVGVELLDQVQACRRGQQQQQQQVRRQRGAELLDGCRQQQEESRGRNVGRKKTI